MINKYKKVLNCTEQEAIFFLESSGWNISTAISLCIESNESNNNLQIGLNMVSSLKRQRVDSFDTFMYRESAQNEEEEGVVVGSRFSGREVIL